MYIFVKQNIDNVYGNFLYLFDIERIQFCIKNNFGIADTNTVGFFSKRYNGYILFNTLSFEFIR